MARSYQFLLQTKCVKIILNKNKYTTFVISIKIKFIVIFNKKKYKFVVSQYIYTIYQQKCMVKCILIQKKKTFYTQRHYVI